MDKSYCEGVHVTLRNAIVADRKCQALPLNAICNRLEVH